MAEREASSTCYTWIPQLQLVHKVDFRESLLDLLELPGDPNVQPTEKWKARVRKLVSLGSYETP